MINHGVLCIQNAWKSHNISPGEIEKIIPPNVRHDVYHDVYSKMLGISPDLFYLNNVSNGEHISDIDIIRNLVDYESNSKKNRGEFICLYSVDIEPTNDINYHLITLRRNLVRKELSGSSHIV